MYEQQVDDPWFSAHAEYLFENPIPFLHKRYARDTAISTLGCVELYQVCTDNKTCTPLLGFDQVQNTKLLSSGLSPHQNATLGRVIRANSDASIHNVVDSLSRTTTPMLASGYATGGKSGLVISRALPNDQWKTEVQYWHSVAMAHFQRSLTQWATGEVAAQPQYLLPPKEEQDVWFCDSLVVPSLIYQSFSVLAIIIIIVIGLLVIVASFNVESLAALIRKCRRRPALRKQTWNDDYMLGMKRLEGDAWKPTPPEKDDVYGGPLSEKLDSPNLEWEMLPKLSQRAGRNYRKSTKRYAQSRGIPCVPLDTSFQRPGHETPPRPPRYS